MEPSPPPQARAEGAGELVIQNGRQSGARRPLVLPMTLLGRAPGCDVRLNVAGVAAYHCALVQGPGGLVLRSLQAENPSQVNGKPVAACALRDGDEVGVGPFRFKVQLAHGAGADTMPLGAAALHDLEIVQREREALRIQAAAVAAQQAALTEEESKLRQRET